jgi:hypothetical protein
VLKKAAIRYPFMLSRVTVGESVVMKKISIILLASLTASCATTEYAKRLTDAELLYTSYERAAPETQTFSAVEAENVALEVGSGRSGFIPPDRSIGRLNFERAFPAEVASESDYDELGGMVHLVRAGQVVLFSADLDRRTAGATKDKNGNPVSLTGLIDVRSPEAMSQAVVTGIGTGVAMGTVSVSAANAELAKSGLQLTSSAANQAVLSSAATGLLGGLIAGAIIEHQVNSAIKGIVAASDFGSRMQEATLRPEAPHAVPISPAGLTRNVEPERIIPGVVRRVMMYRGQTDYKNNQLLVFISVVVVFRGEKYAKEYPSTSGWEYRITNINVITAQKTPNDSEALYKTLRDLLPSAGVRL